MKKRSKRICALVFCVFMICGLACPVFAADLVSDLDYIYVGSLTLYESSFALTDDNYSVTFTPPGFQVEDVSLCAVSFVDEVVLLKWGKSDYSYLPCYYIGNGALVDTERLDDTGEAFVLALNRQDKTQSKFVCTPEFFNQYIRGSGDAGFEITLSVPSEDNVSTVPGLMSGVVDVFSSALDMAGTVAVTVASNPILLLPVLVGFVGVAIVFFKQLQS